jgi:nitrogen regulatory protein PII
VANIFLNTNLAAGGGGITALLERVVRIRTGERDQSALTPVGA